LEGLTASIFTLYPEDGGSRVLQKLVTYHNTTWHHNPEERNLIEKLHSEDGDSNGCSNMKTGVKMEAARSSLTYYTVSQTRKHQLYTKWNFNM
jgi:hypothetical protein